MDRQQVTKWLTRYEEAWRSTATAALAGLFTADASYLQGPYQEPVVGLPAIGRMWDETRDGPDEVFQVSSEIVAVDGDTAVARLEVRYGEPVEQEYRDLWIMRFAEDGLCREFQEWPFWPGQPYTADG